MNAYRIRPLKYPWPTVLYLFAVAAALTLARVTPFHLTGDWRLLLEGLGAAAIIAGAFLVGWAWLTLFRCKAAKLSHRSAAHLVTSGPFRITRNPVYLGYTLMTLGAGLLADNSWMMLAALVAAAFTHLYVIRKEEIHLLARFGFEFERYCRRTRAWI